MAGQVLTIAQQKGGSGKTTLAVHIAVQYLREGKRVAILDTDPQGSLGRWFMERHGRTDGAPGLEFGTASAWGVTYECEKLSRDHDIVVVDTPPKIDADLRPSLRIADLVVVPVTTSQVDVWALSGLQDMAERESCKALAVMNRVPPRARLTEAITAEVDAAGIQRATAYLGNRVAYAEALGQGKSAMELARSGPASKEVAALVAELQAALG